MAARVLCGVTSPHPVTVEGLTAFAPQAEVADVSGGDEAYWHQISARWAGEADLVIIEQDIEIRQDTVISLADCSEDWCCFAYRIFARGIRLRTGLGCTKFSAALQRKIPAEVIAEGFAGCDGCAGRACWWHLDWHIATALKQAGLEPHVHGDVTHLRAYPLQSWLWPTHMAGRPVEEVFGDTDRPDRDLPAIGPLSPAGVVPFAAELLQRGQEAVAAQAEAVALSGGWPDDGWRQNPRPYQTDKVTQGYMGTYRDIAADLGPAARVCEVGVHAGGSLATWQDLFPDGTVAGVDIDPGACWPPGTIRVVASQDDPDLPALLGEHEAAWDLIVDDASHDGTLTAVTLGLLWPLVAPGGFYAIEDWFTGFGDYTGACKSPAMLGVVQGLLERLHRDTDTEWVSYRYGMAVIRKKEQPASPGR